MLRLSRRSHSRAIDPEYQCCVCLHVRIGTILLGVIQILAHLVTIGLVIALIFSPHLLDRFMKSHHLMNMNQQNIPHDQVKDHLTKDPALTEAIAKDHQHNPYLTLAQVLLSLSFCCMLLYGAASHKPYYLLPYFCLQVLDFVIVCLGVIQSVTYIADVRMWIHNNQHVLYKQHLFSCSYRVLVIFAMALTFLIIAGKAYLIGMVWSCYKYLVMKRSNRLTDHRDTDVEICITAPELPDDSTENQFTPPKYEEVLKTPANAFMPPPYYVEDLSQQATVVIDEDNK